MQFQITVQSTDSGWIIEILDSKTGKSIFPHGHPTRQLRRLGDDLQAFPLPSEEEVKALPTGSKTQQLCKALCGTSNVADVLDIYARIINRAPEYDEEHDKHDMEVFGCYLFATLLGMEAWEKIWDIAQHDNGQLELALTWQSDDQTINRLPWEMMHGPDKFLAEMPGVAITRRVSGTAQIPKTIKAQPHVLFVVGTEIGRDVIRPGAEYLGLMRTLQQTGLRLTTHLLLRATTEKLSAAIKFFQPTIVHFICHGGFEEGKSYLELMDNEKPDSAPPVRVSAKNLIQALSPDSKSFPSVVILSACSTADIAQEAGQIASPLAVELIKEGIPIVVGMAGEVSDQACRLFTKRFFKALVEKGDIAHAVAEGRRGGIISHSGSDPRASVDWSLPTLFLSAGMKESRIDIRRRPPVYDWNAIADNDHFATSAYPPFCDRLEPLQWCDILMADDSTQQELTPLHRTLQVLAIAVDIPTGPGNKIKYGLTSLLRAMAAHAVRNSHVPCLLTENEVNGHWPKTAEDLLNAIKKSCSLVTAPLFGVNPPPDWKYIPLLLRQDQGETLPDWFPQELKSSYNIVNQNPKDPMLIAIAFRLDLLDFLNTIRSKLPKGERNKTKLLLLIDDVHRMGDAAGYLLEHLCGNGLRDKEAKTDVRVIFTYSTTAEVGEESAVVAIIDWLPKKHFAHQIPLTKFKPPLESRLAYHQFLLNWRDGNRMDGKIMAMTPIALNKDNVIIELFFSAIHRATEGGIPRYLDSVEVLQAIEEFRDIIREKGGYEFLRVADDEDVLKFR